MNDDDDDNNRILSLFFGHIRRKSPDPISNSAVKSSRASVSTSVRDQEGKPRTEGPRLLSFIVISSLLHCHWFAASAMW